MMNKEQHIYLKDHNIRQLLKHMKVLVKFLLIPQIFQIETKLELKNNITCLYLVEISVTYFPKLSALSCKNS